MTGFGDEGQSGGAAGTYTILLNNGAAVGSWLSEVVQCTLKDIPAFS